MVGFRCCSVVCRSSTSPPAAAAVVVGNTRTDRHILRHVPRELPARVQGSARECETVQDRPLSAPTGAAQGSRAKQRVHRPTQDRYVALDNKQGGGPYRQGARPPTPCSCKRNAQLEAHHTPTTHKATSRIKSKRRAPFFFDLFLPSPLPLGCTRHDQSSAGIVRRLRRSSLCSVSFPPKPQGAVRHPPCPEVVAAALGSLETEALSLAAQGLCSLPPPPTFLNLN